MSDLRLYVNGEPAWVVAESRKEALDLWCAHTGEAPEDYDLDDWDLCHEQHAAKYWIDDTTGCITEREEPGASLITLTAAEVVERFGRGFVASGAE